MKKKTLLLGVAILVIGLVVMPSTVSLFQNQHTWQQTSSIICTSCHADIKAELESASNYHHNASSLGVGSTEAACKYCHQTQYGRDSGSHADWESEVKNNSAHAAFTVECLDCHGNSTIDDDPNAKDIAKNFTNASTNEAHKPLYDEAVSSTLMQGANEACVACHTGINLKATFVFNYQMNITANQTTGNWVLGISLYNP